VPKPYFSIIIPALNEEKYLPHLLDDLVHQTLLNFEVIVVDGNSTDQTLQKATTFLSRLPSLTLLTSQKSHVSVQRNLGARSARADYFVFIDADNRLPNHFLQMIKAHLESTPTDILSTRFEPDQKTFTNLAVTNALNIFLEIQNNYKPTYLVEGMLVASRKCFQQIGGFDESVNFSEGKSFIQSAIKKGFHSQYIRTPVWIYCFRRIRKYGLMNLAARTARMEISDLLGIDPHHHKFSTLYPMQGGNFFDEPARTKLLLRLKSRLQSSRARQKFLLQLEKILSYLES